MKKSESKRSSFWPYTKWDVKPTKESTEPSQTIPGEAYTIRELLTKFTRGVIPDVGKNMKFDDSEDFEDIDISRVPDFDLSDITEYKENIEAAKELYEKAKAKAKAKKTEPSEGSESGKKSDGEGEALTK